jgi:hypothetical protein
MPRAQSNDHDKNIGQHIFNKFILIMYVVYTRVHKNAL